MTFSLKNWSNEDEPEPPPPWPTLPLCDFGEPPRHGGELGYCPIGLGLGVEEPRLELLVARLQRLDMGHED